MRSTVLVLLVPLFFGCNTTGIPLPGLSLDGNWQVVFDGSELPTCITITDERVTTVLSDCVNPQPVISATQASHSNGAVSFSHVLGGVRQTDAGLMAVEIKYEYFGTVQGDGSISANRVITATLNGMVIDAFNDAVIMTRR